MRKSIIVLLLVVISIISKAQTIKTEDCITSKTATSTFFSPGSDYTSFKLSRFYYNDKIVIFIITGFKKSPFYFKIYKKYINDDGDLVINCFDNHNNYGIEGIPTVSIILNYNASMNNVGYVDVLAKFWHAQTQIGFDFNAKSTPAYIPAIKKRFAKLF